MTTSCNPKPGEIWLAYVEFSDHPGVGKVRPVVVLEVRESTCVALAAKVTSKDLKAAKGVPCAPIIGWESCGLRAPSYVRLDQRLVISFERLLRGEPLGSVSELFLKLIIGEINANGC